MNTINTSNTTNASYSSEFDTLTVNGNHLPKFEMKLNNISILPTQLSFVRAFNKEMTSSRILSYHEHKFRVTVTYNKSYSNKFSLQTQVLTSNGWSVILTGIDIPTNEEDLDYYYDFVGEDLKKLNDVTNHIEEEFIKMICLLYLIKIIIYYGTKLL